MSQALFVASVVFWGVVVLSVLVFAHEAGHFLAARACGVRVTEFFLGMPCRARLSRRSRTRGTEYGVTPILLGGYTRICGMSGEPGGHAAEVLACVQRHGRVRVDELAEEVGCGTDEAYDELAALAEWASVEPYYDPDLGEREGQDRWPAAFQTVDRDAGLLTVYDAGHGAVGEGGTRAGEAQALPEGGAEELLRRERARTYQGSSLPRRLLMLVAGPFASFVAGALLLVVALSGIGMDLALNTNAVGSVSEGSPAQAAGLEAGDVVVAVDGTAVDDFDSVSSAVAGALAEGKPFEVSYLRDGVERQTSVTPDGTGLIGISAPVERVRLSVVDSLSLTFEYSAQVVDFAVRLIIPTETMKVVGSASSVVGISVMASEAAAAGPAQLVMLAAAVSLSLAFMNLLPVPPLDGGKVAMELIGAVRRRPLSLRAQNAASLVGLALFLLLFVVALRQDIVRLMIGWQ